MSKVLLVTVDYLPRTGGVAKYYGQLVAELAPEVAVLTNVAGPAAAGVIRRQLTWWLWPRWLPMLWQVPRARREVGATRLWIGEVVPTGIAALLLKIFHGVPYVVSVHGLDIQLQTKRGWWKRSLTCQILRQAQCVVANSRFTASLLEAWGVAEHKRVVVYPGVELGVPVPAASMAQLRTRYHLAGRRVLLAVARLVRRKGIDDVLAVLPELQRTVPNLTYVVVGDGPERTRLERIARRLGVTVVFTGMVDNKELAAWYELCDVFVLTPKDDPTDVEGFGMVYLEAQAAGKPVVATRVGGVPEAVAEAGVLVDNAMQLQAALEELLTSSERREQLGQQGVKRVQEFTWGRQAATLRRVLEK